MSDDPLRPLFRALGKLPGLRSGPIAKRGAVGIGYGLAGLVLLSGVVNAVTPDSAPPTATRAAAVAASATAPPPSPVPPTAVPATPVPPTEPPPTAAPTAPPPTPVPPTVAPTRPSTTQLPAVQASVFRDRNCPDFRTWREAQDFYLAQGGNRTPRRDPHGLDTDNDGIACENLPGAPRS